MHDAVGLIGHALLYTLNEFHTTFCQEGRSGHHDLALVVVMFLKLASIERQVNAVAPTWDWPTRVVAHTGLMNIDLNDTPLKDGRELLEEFKTNARPDHNSSADRSRWNNEVSLILVVCVRRWDTKE